MRPLAASGGELDDASLARLYAYPREQWLRANFVSSADGAGSLDGLSAGLSSEDDRRLFGILRVLADVVLVGASTARAEKYKPARRREGLAEFRAGRPATPPIAVVSRSLGLDLESPLFTAAAAGARTIVITCAAAPGDLRAAAGRAADVIVAGTEAVDLKEAAAALAGRGLRRVICEGGPHLLAQVAAAGLLDELCLTVSPLLAGPGPARIIAGSPFPARPMTLAHVLESGGFLFCRYVTQAPLPGLSPLRRRRGPGDAHRVGNGTNYVYRRDYVVGRLRSQGLPELADLALRELPDPVDVEQIEAWAMRYGITKDSLISQMGGSP